MQPNDIPIVAKVVADALKKATAPLLERLALVEARQPEKGEKGDPGECGADGQAGKDATVDLDALVLKVAELVPTPKDGRDGIDGKDGKDVNPEMVMSFAKEIIDNIPKPKDGRDGINGKDGSDGIAGKDGAAGLDGAKGADGINGKDADQITLELVLDALGASPALLQKAVTFYLTENPPAAGKDGANGLSGKDGKDGIDGKEGPIGIPGRDGQMGLPGRDGEKGADGIDGQDGMGFDDIHVEHDGERAFSLKFMRGGREKTFGSFVIPSIIDRGVFKDGQAYHKGDAVSFAGSIFIAQRDTKAKPETSPDWRLGVKRGRDGRDGKDTK